MYSNLRRLDVITKSFVFQLGLCLILLSATIIAQSVDIVFERSLEGKAHLLGFHKTRTEDIAISYAGGYNNGVLLYNPEADYIRWDTGLIRGDSALFVNVFDVRQVGDDNYIAVGISEMSSGILFEYPAAFSISKLGSSVRVFMDSTLLVRNLQNQAYFLNDTAWVMTGYNYYLYQGTADTLEYSVPTLNTFNTHMTWLLTDTIAALYKPLSKNVISSVEECIPLSQGGCFISLSYQQNKPWTVTNAVVSSSKVATFIETTPSDSVSGDEGPRACESGGYIWIAQTRRYAYHTDSIQIVVRKLRAEGALLSESAFYLGRKLSKVMACRPTHDGGCIVCLEIGDGAQKWLTFEYCLIRINSNGTLRWKKIWSKNVGNILRDVIELGDGDFLVGGSYNDSSHTALSYLARLHESIVADVGAGHHDSMSVRICPQPAENAVMITASIEASSLTIRDICGLIVHKKQFSACSEVSIDVTEFPTGIYMLQWNTDSNPLRRQFLVCH